MDMPKVTQSHRDARRTQILDAAMICFARAGFHRTTMQEIVQQAASQNTDPRAEEIIERFLSPQGLAILLTIVLVMSFVGFLIFSSLGGALGAYLLKRRER